MSRGVTPHHRQQPPRHPGDRRRPGAGAHEGQFDSLRLAVEAPHWYWFPLCQALRQAPALPALALGVVRLQPGGSRPTTRRASADKDKTDDSDAQIVADRLRTYRRRDLPAPCEPDLAHLGLLSDPLPLPWSRIWCAKELLRGPAVPQSQRLPCRAPFCGGLRRHQPGLDRGVCPPSRKSLPCPRVVADLARYQRQGPLPRSGPGGPRAAAGGSGFLPLGCPATNSQSTDSLDLELPVRQLPGAPSYKRVDGAIAEAMHSLPQTLDTIPGIGPVYAASIIAEIGDLARFDHDEAKPPGAACTGARTNPASPRQTRFT